MRSEREARLQSELAQEPDFVRRQELLKALWHLAQQHDEKSGQTQARRKQTTAAAAARANRADHPAPRMAV